MLKTLTLLAGLTATPVFGRTVHSVIIFSRHGDRTSKFYKGYQMTDLGATQCYNSGQYYRNLYIADGAPSQIAGISPDDASYAQRWASAPDQSVLFQTALNFLQGLYPPLGEMNPALATEELVNRTSAEAPLNGYQYIHIQGEADNAPDTIWLKGDDECPAWTNASKTYKSSEAYRSTLSSTLEFYDTFVPLLGDILGAETVSYAQAYNVFDLHTASVQNSSIAASISATDLDQTRHLANEWEWNMNYNSSQPDRGIGGESLAGGILRQLEAVVEDEARTKFSLMTGSYDTFMAFFGLIGLQDVSGDFMGLPNYAASVAFEVFSEADNATFPAADDGDVRVRFLFRNGTEGGEELRAWPLFGQEEEALSYGDFSTQLRQRAITSVGEWCERCGASAEFCGTATGEGSDEAVEDSGSGDDRLSNAAAGGIGAGVTLAVVAIVGLIAWALLRKKNNGAVQGQQMEKRLSDGGSGSEIV